MSGHMVDLPDNMSGRRWKIISRPDDKPGKKILETKFLSLRSKKIKMFQCLVSLAIHLKVIYKIVIYFTMFRNIFCKFLRCPSYV